ncbi:MAG: hypothetical protein J5779_00590 [Clostridia bacterium]|nr:hypothetical protein [Clostridia bacterium]
MKKLLNTVLVLLSFALLIVLALDAVNAAIVAAGAAGFIDMAKFGKMLEFLKTYGTLIIVSALVFVNLLAKSLFRIIFVILFLLAFGLYIFASAFPGAFTGLFGI